ncbi:HEPN domain-containing protein [Acidianus sp. HS-5]|uniref:HEPN domain-containing protein n=1 Tax=Acidianus sp. HS-5 TaxID=2886040 RepID=UPI001F28FAD9|nr:HEPN domain-containing protein [Acidianus sp. HS-5]BDC18536.1 DNA-binding protein [Acidianus sp. HS-5]
MDEFLEFLEASIEEFSKGRYRVSCLLCQVSAELLIRSIFNSRGLKQPIVPSHDIRTLLGRLNEESLYEFIKENRKGLDAVSNCRKNSQYGKVSKEEAEDCIKIVKLLIKELKNNGLISINDLE